MDGKELNLRDVRTSKLYCRDSDYEISVNFSETLSICNVSVITPLSSLESFCVIKWCKNIWQTGKHRTNSYDNQVWYSSNKSYDLHSSLENSSFDQLDSW